MSDRISAGRALGAGFRIIGREPLAFAAWCLGYFVISAVPLALSWPHMAALYELLGSGADVTAPEIMAAQQKLMAYQPLSFVTGIIAMVCLPAAAMRAVLYPDDRRFFYLRIDARELWFGLVTAVLIVGWVIGFFALFIPIAVIMGLGAAFGGGGLVVSGLLMTVLMPIAFGVAIWAILRLSMGPTMSFAQKTFRLTESWAFTRGHAGRMVLVGLALTGVVFLAEIVLLFAIVLPAGGLERLETANPFAGLSSITMPVLLAGLAVLSVLVVTYYVVGAAAWADMYRQLRPDFSDTFD